MSEQEYNSCEEVQQREKRLKNGKYLWNRKLSTQE